MTILCENLLQKTRIYIIMGLVDFKSSSLIAVQYNASICGRRWAMEQTKLTVRVPRDLLKNVKLYATQNNTTLTKLIEAYLRRIPAQAPLDDVPIGRRLSGILPENVSIRDYHEHLEEK
jgi:hypothetical protein